MRTLERREAALLTLLAIEGPLPRARAAALLWADADRERARSSLRQRLFKLRRAAGTDVIVPDELLRIADGVTHDLVPIAPQLEADPAAAAAELLGDLDYSDCPGLDEWVAVAREQWRGRRIQALAEIAARHETEQHVAAALPYAERLVADDPTLEHGHRRLMRLHYLRGDRSAALAAFARCRELLTLHAGAQPGKETLELAALIERSGELPQARRMPVPMSVLRPPRMVGREAEWGAIESALDAGQCVLLLGEPGAGKSRLLGDLARHRGALLVGARPGDERAAYALLSRLLRALIELSAAALLGDELRAELARLLPELGAAAATPPTTGRLVTAVQGLMHATGARHIVIDDLHFADDSTLEMLPELVPATRHTVDWLLAARPAEIPQALDAWRQANATEGLREVSLAPLDINDVRVLLESLAIEGLDAGRLCGPLTRHTGGNPLFVLETLRARIERGASVDDPLPLPDSVGQLIERRLAQLSPAAVGLARAAAVAGSEFGPDLAAHVTGKAPLDLIDPWHELERAQVMRDNAFSHDLIPATLLRSVPDTILAVLHRDIARFLAPRGAEPARIAAHWEAAGEPEHAAQNYRAAAKAAHRMAQHKVECRWLAAAARNFAQAGDSARRFEALFSLVAASRIVDPHGVVREHAEQLLAAAVTDEERALAHESLAQVLNDAFAFAPALAAIDALRALPAAALRPERLASIARIEAAALCQLARQDEARARLQPFLHDALARPQDGEHAALLSDYGLTLIASERHREALDILTRARAGAEVGRDIATLYAVDNNLAWCTYSLGRLKASTAHYEDARHWFAMIGNDRPPQTKHEMGLARQYRELGRFGEALALIEATVDEQRSAGNTALLTMSSCELASLYSTLGQPARARSALVAPAGDVAASVRAACLFTEARLRAAEGQPARVLFEEALELVRQEGRPYYVWRVQLELCAALDPEAAAALARQILDGASQHDLVCVTLPARAVAANSLLRCRRISEAVTVVRDLLAPLAGTEPMTLYAPFYWLTAYQVLWAAEHAEEAMAALARGRAWILDTALPQVPQPFRDSFLNRNPVNRDLLAAARRVLG